MNNQPLTPAKKSQLKSYGFNCIVLITKDYFGGSQKGQTVVGHIPAATIAYGEQIAAEWQGATMSSFGAGSAYRVSNVEVEVL